MVAASVRRDERLAFGSAELRLVYPQIYRRPIPGPDHATAVVARCELLGGDPRALALRVLAEARACGLLAPDAEGHLVSAHAPKPRAQGQRSEEHDREAAARRTRLMRARERGDTRPDSQILAEYVYRPRGPRKAPPPPPACDAACDATPPGVVTPTPQGVVTPHTVTAPPSERMNEDSNGSSSSSSDSEKPRQSVAVTARETPPPPPSCYASAVTRDANVTDPPSPPPPPAGVTYAVAAGILGGGSAARIGMAGAPDTRARFEGLLAQYEVTREELGEIARLARAGGLLRQDKHQVVDLQMLAPRSGDQTVFTSWINAARGAIGKRERERERERPRQPSLGLPDNEVSTGPPSAVTEPRAGPVKAEQLRAGLAFGTRAS